jgi:DNA-binding IclR family transcriptional regulator
VAESAENPEPGGVRNVRSAERTTTVLEYLSTAAGPRSLRQVTQDLRLPRASAYALLTTLVRTGWVENDRAGAGYRLGIKALRAGAAYVEHDDVVQRAQTVMDDLCEELGETIHLARLDGAEIVYLATAVSRHSLAVISRPGRRLPCWATGLGKVIMAQRPWEEVDALLPAVLTPRTPHTFTERAALKDELARIAERGYARDDQESTLGTRCVAVPLHFGEGVAESLSCSAPAVRMDPEREQTVLEALLRARTAITR